MDIKDVKLFEPKRFTDTRGFFSELFDTSTSDISFVQDKYSYNAKKGTVRGLHFQTSPRAMDKLVYVMRGSILDVAVDIRRDSPTFGHYASALLSFDNGKQFLVPKGFAHGFCTLEDDCVVCYKTSDISVPEHDRGLFWNDPDIGIAWPFPVDTMIVSDKDKNNPRLKELPEDMQCV